jgi:alpha-glucosidase (family GH31 glycosyl hydrolase)
MAKDSSGFTGYDTHNLYATQQSNQTWWYFYKPAYKRPFILTRSGSSGIGKYSQRYIGENYSTQESLAASIPAIMQQNIFGIPFAGADVCGFYGNTSP